VLPLIQGLVLHARRQHHQEELWAHMLREILPVAREGVTVHTCGDGNGDGDGVMLFYSYGVLVIMIVIDDRTNEMIRNDGMVTMMVTVIVM
jgi:hypothetical protein